MTTPYLTDEEIAGICRPLRQKHAQVRYLRDVLKLPVERRPDGSPLVRRVDWDRAHPAAEQPKRGAPRWSVA